MLKQLKRNKKKPNPIDWLSYIVRMDGTLNFIMNLLKRISDELSSFQLIELNSFVKYESEPK